MMSVFFLIISGLLFYWLLKPAHASKDPVYPSLFADFYHEKPSVKLVIAKRSIYKNLKSMAVQDE